MKIAIVGTGAFGSFLWRELHRVASDSIATPYDTGIDTVILAVPSSAYDKVARKYRGMHLINVCSTQAKTNWICQKYSDKVTGIHPLFGPRSPMEGRTAIVTTRCEESAEFLDVFDLITTGGLKLMLGGNGLEHDKVMSKVHIPVVQLQARIKEIIKGAEGIAKDHIPTSFHKLREFSETFGDMPEGTLSSILDNPFYKE